MTDHELLEMAAKAVGIALKPMQINNMTYQGDDRFIGYMTDPGQWPRGWFDPLTDDDDAFKLVVDCQLDIAYSGSWVFVSRDEQFDEVGEAIGADARAATRRAIVKAAAEIGKGME